MSIDFPIAPFEADRWSAVRARGRISFVFRYGLPFGVVIAAVLDTALLFMSGNGDLALSVWRIPRLALSIATFGPILGAAVGQLLWDRGESRFRNHLLKEAFRGDDAAGTG
ncbi:MAG: hypothetical protein HOQ11_00910 [Gemmatimonadaceae bacterium]|nr:hypothetical protein [Gemmatimonadaceae bacterium]NUQ92878.1 hypothetical protein [Gemmatimonadaceae bacterium]NUR18777.1 hypothetical protein [Gemmatimonadaceae bacterium]NUS95947.1 hypothetical protein [Gemmatimonadaceae bacterium]